MSTSALAGTEDNNEMRGLKWSPVEKAVARRAFELALGRELEQLIHEVKDRAARIKQPPQLWELERHLTKCRKDIDRRYDFRYSILPLVFGSLIREGRLTEEVLQGLGEDKLAIIRGVAAL